MTAYNVTARRWAEGWELHIEGEGVTQVRTLDRAVQQVRDYLETLHDRDFSDADLSISFDLDGFEETVGKVRVLVSEATKAQREAAEQSRQVANKLRVDLGLSVTDTAAILGVSRGRVSQLTS